MASIFPSELTDIANKVATLLKERGETVSVCETAAGGLISASLLSVPGASRIFLGGLTAYQLRFREQYVGWTDADTSSYHGPTPGIVSKLAVNVRERLLSTWAIGESGTAGPANPVKGHGKNREPGYVALAVVGPDGVTEHDLNTGSEERAENMVKFAVEALRLLEQQLMKGKQAKV